MPTGSTPPQTDLAALRDYCEAKVPPHLQDEVRVECRTRGSTVTIDEARPPWQADAGTEWTRQAVAQLRFDSSTLRWTLYYADRNRRWHRYEQVKPTTNVNDLMSELDEDPTGIFWG